MKEYQGKGWLEEHYIKQKLSTPEMARIAGCTCGTIRYWLDKHGIERRSISEGKKIAAAQRLKDKLYTDREWLYARYWDENLNIYKIGELAGCAGTTILRWMEKLGIPRRSRSEAGLLAWDGNEERRQQFSDGIRAAWENGSFDAPEYKETISRKAKARWASGHHDGKNHPRWNSQEVKCAACGASLFRPPGRLDSTKDHFCDLACRGAWMSKNMRGENHPRWCGGPEPYPTEFNQEFKEMIRERDGRKCVLCGKTEKENGQRLSVHHVTYDKDNLDPDLKVSLCISCHGRTNGDRAFWTTVFTQYWRRVLVQDWQHRQVVT